MIDRTQLKQAILTVTGADAAYGSGVPLNWRRYIYKIKVTNENPAGPQLLTVEKRENSAIVSTPIDYIQTFTQYDIWVDPEELHEDMEPLYTIEGPPGSSPTNTSYLWMQVDNGSAYVFIEYIDSPK